MTPTGIDPRTPVIVGAGQVVQRPDDGAAADPITLAVRALRAATHDSGGNDTLIQRADSVRSVATTGWLYRDEAALIATVLGASPRETVRTCQFGGDGPQRLIGDTARAIAAGEIEIALVSGAEAIASSVATQREGGAVDWPGQPEGEPTRVIGVDRQPVNEPEVAVGLIAPLNVYALLETAVRARAGVERSDHLEAISILWSRYSEVAASNPYAWLPRRHTPAEIAASRLVSEPYTKLLSANIQVDQAAALIICSASAAAAAGVPKDRWVFPVASAFAQDEWFLSEREQLAASPAIQAAGNAVLAHAGVSIDEVEFLDFYSCFPSAVQIAAAELGVALGADGRVPTVTGGLTFAGGPGNNYSLHAVATLVDRLRARPDALGLSSALGWYSTKHAYGLYSGTPREPAFRELDATPRIRPSRARRATTDYSGPATLEAYTVPYGRDGNAEAVVLSAIAPDRSRVLLRTDDPETVGALLTADPLGRTVQIVAGSPPRIELEAGTTAGAGR